MNLEKCEPKKYTTEELKEIKTDLRNLLTLIESELDERKQKRFEALVSDMLVAIDNLSKEFPHWESNFELTFSAENWQSEQMSVTDFRQTWFSP